MTPTFTGMAGRVAIALLLVLLAAGSALAAATTLPGLANNAQPAEETAEPSDSATADPTTEPSGSPAADPTTEPSASPEASATPEATAPAAREAEEPEESEDVDENDTAPSLANLERIVAKLAAAGITTTTDKLAELSAEVGVGGAVRVLLFADASGSTAAEILALFESGKGWGVIAKDLDLAINPGLGSVMGNGKGHDKAAKAAEKAARAQERAERKAGSGE